MATRDTSVNLIISAKNQATPALETITATLAKMFNSASTGKTQFAEIAAALSTVDKAAAKVSASVEKGEAAFANLNTRLAGNKAELAALEKQAAAAAAVLARLNSPDAIVGAGRDQSGRLAQVKATSEAYSQLQNQIQKLGGVVAADESKLNASRSSLQQLASAATAAAEQQAKLREELERRAEVQRRIADETRRAADASRYQTDLNSRITPSLSRGPATANGAGFEALAAKLQADEQAAEKLRRSLDPLGAATRDAAAEIQRLRGFEQQGLLTATELAEAERRVSDALRQRTSQLGVLTAAQQRANEESRRAVDAARFQSDLNGRINPSTRGPATANGAGFEALAAKVRADEQSAARIRAELNPLATIQKAYNDQIREAIRLRREELISTEDLKKRITQLRAESARAQVDFRRNGGSGVGIFGLRPYEVTNLGYQINDLVTQVASGTSVTQALAQQGGQILQILPQIGTKLIALATNPWALTLAAGIATVAVGFNELSAQAERFRQINGALAANTSGGLYDAQKLTDAAASLAGFGVSAEEATAAFRTFISEGVREEQIVRFTIAARNLADVTGGDLKQAVSSVSTAFTSGYDAIAKLDDKLNFLTASEREHIRALFESGQAQQARGVAFAAFERQQDAGAEKARGPWTNAVRELSGAWQEFKNFLSDTTVFKTVGDAFGEMASGIARNLRMLRGEATIADLNAKISEKVDQIAGLQNGRGGIIAMLPGFRQNATRQLEEEIRQLEARRDKLQAAQQAAEGTGGTGKPGDTINGDENSAMAKRRAERLAALSIEDQLYTLQREAAKGLTETEIKRRGFLAGQIAFNKEIATSGDQIVAAKERELAVDKEIAAARKQQEAFVKQQQSERESAIQKFQQRVIGAEGGTAKNPYSSAQGYGQFIDSTFLEQYKKVFGTDTGRSDAQILALRQNQAIAKAVIDNYTRENARFLEKFGAEVTAGNLYLAHFLGAGDAKKILKADTGTRVDSILSDKVLSANQGYFRKNNGKGDYRTAGELRTFIAGRVGDTGAAQSAGVVALQELENKQTSLNRKIDDENTLRQKNADEMRIEGDLTGRKLLDAQRIRAVNEAAATAEKEYADLRAKGVAVDEAEAQKRIQRIRETVRAEFDARNQKQYRQADIAEATGPVDKLVAERKSLQDQLEAAQRTGDVNLAGRLADQIQGVNSKLEEAIDKAIRFWQALGGPEADAAIAKLEVIKQTMAQAGTQFLMTGRQINESIANGVAGAFDNFAKNVAEGKNVFKSLRDAFLQFAADFLRQIAQMIIKQAIFNAIGGATGTGGAGGAGGAGGGIAGFIGGLFHNGGVVGEGGGQLRGGMNPAWFASATRYHTGGIIGLQPDEMPAVLRKGEEVLTRGDPRHRANGGASSGGSGPTKIVNVFDAGQAAEEILRTPAGEKAMLNFVSNNRDAFKAAIGG